MNLAVGPHRVIESVDRRVMGAFQLVDAATRLPIAVPAIVTVRHATVGGTPDEIRLPQGAVRIQRNRSGLYVVMQAPFFDAYSGAFDNPIAPPETQAGALRLQVSIDDAGPHYLPQTVQFDLPRPLDPAVAGSVFEPRIVSLFRAPSAPALDGWTVLRVRVTRSNTNPAASLPGVLVRVFRSPRVAGDAPIAAGLTDWRGRVVGEAFVPLTDLQRFRPGSGANVIERDYAIEFDATRDTNFDGSGERWPDAVRLESGTGSGVVRASLEQPNPELVIVRPPTPVRVQAGREYVVHLAMP